MALKKDAKRKEGNEERREDLFAFKTPNICQAFHTLFSLLTPLALSLHSLICGFLTQSSSSHSSMCEILKLNALQKELTDLKMMKNDFGGKSCCKWL